MSSIDSLPDCESCSADDTLSVVALEGSVRRCVCSCCGKVCRVNANGAVVWEARQTDVGGQVIDGL